MKNLKLFSIKEVIEDSSQPPKPIIDNGVLLDGTILLILGHPTYLPINRTDYYDYLYELVKDNNPDVLILDPLIRFHDVDENSASQISDVFVKIRTMMSELKISVILVHHTGKVQSRGGRGSSAIIGEYDSCIEIQNKQNDSIELKYDMRHVETPPSKSIRFNSDTFWFEDESGIVELIESAGGSMPKEHFFTLYGKPESTTYRHIEKAVKSGLIEKHDKHLVLTE